MPKFRVDLNTEEGAYLDIEGTTIDTEYGELRITDNNATVAIFGNDSWRWVREVNE